MESIRISLPDGSVIEAPRGTTIRDLAARLSPRLAARA
ncbi:MAG TPA: TGS domain-containing protein, partial [Bacillota bacterium]|nr:TGS domain-containing protein [Bacillota bacterium]